MLVAKMESGRDRWHVVLTDDADGDDDDDDDDDDDEEEEEGTVGATLFGINMFGQSGSNAPVV